MVLTSRGGCEESLSFRQSLAQSEHFRDQPSSEAEGGCPGYPGRHTAGNQPCVLTLGKPLFLGLSFFP